MPEVSVTVSHLPEPLSPTYRNRVRNPSARNRNQGGHHLPVSRIWNKAGSAVTLRSGPGQQSGPRSVIMALTCTYGVELRGLEPPLTPSPAAVLTS